MEKFQIQMLTTIEPARRSFIICLVILASLIHPGLLAGQENSRPPNIILIMADDLGYGDIGCFGNTEIKTPNLDQMAKEGVRFIDFHSNGAVCSPTRAALLTGRYQQRTGITGVITAKNHREVGLPLSEVTIAEALKKEGYTTGIFGKWHLGYAKAFNPVHQGFDEFIGFLSGNVDYHSHVDQAGFSDWWRGEEPFHQTGYSTDLISENAIDFIEKNRESPFFLYIAHEAPHSPYQNRASKADRKPGGAPGIDFPVFGSESDFSLMLKDMIEIMDETIGDLFKALQAFDLSKNTVVIFISDNGATTVGSNGNLRGFKSSLWEGGHRVPAIIHWPGFINAGWVSEETVLTMDLFPTIMEWAGVQYDYNLDGISIAQHLLQNNPLQARNLFWQHGKDYAVRSGKWKLLLADNENIKLFDVETDIEEQYDVAEKYPDIKQDLLDLLESWKNEVFK
ncbi:MAG: sulfatase-like hydrolase/transferase [Cyclobacteriaceae bacterium]|nr:sulfatase-like hydrolase/transferase [Cyclobacteriaceae bacterium]